MSALTDEETVEVMDYLHRSAMFDLLLEVTGKNPETLARLIYLRASERFLSCTSDQLRGKLLYHRTKKGEAIAAGGGGN